MLKDEERIKKTQSAVQLEKLISQFMFSKAQEAPSPAPAAAAAPATASPAPAAAAAPGTQTMKSAAILTLTAVAALVLGGCASFPQRRARRSAGADQPRHLLVQQHLRSLSVQADREGHDAAVPNPVKKGVSNVFQNASDAQSIVSDALQLKGAKMGDDLGRVMINTTFGLGGIFDLATPMGIERGNEDLEAKHWATGASAPGRMW